MGDDLMTLASSRTFYGSELAQSEIIIVCKVLTVARELRAAPVGVGNR